MKPTVMIVDDALFIRTVLRGMLEEQGYQVIAEAASGVDALRLVCEQMPELVILDIILPDANGIEILDTLRSHYPAIKIVICSSIRQDATVRKALQHGAIAYLQKPISPDSLAAALAGIETT